MHTEDQLILVDLDDVPIGSAGKAEVHRRGLLHRAFSIFLTDGERMLLRDSAIRDVDVLIAGHHGSKYSTCEELLQAVRPEIVCISVGANNSYGHPAPETLERLREFGCTVYRTDQNGDILIRR